MSKSTLTLAGLADRVSGLETQFTEAQALSAQRHAELVALVTGKAPAKAPKAKAAKAGKAKKAEPTGPTFQQLRMRLKEHKAAGAIKAGVTVKEAIAQGLMTQAGDLPGASSDLTFDLGRPVDVAKAEKKARKAAKKARKAAAQEALVAEVKVEAKAKTAAQEAHLSAPRRADGTCTPKVEWAMRERLAETGKYDRFEIDLMVEAAWEAGVLTR